MTMKIGKLRLLSLRSRNKNRKMKRAQESCRRWRARGYVHTACEPEDGVKSRDDEHASQPHARLLLGALSRLNELPHAPETAPSSIHQTNENMST